MARRLLNESTSPGQLPFLDQLWTAGIVKTGQIFEVKEVSESKKRTGFVLRTDEFMVFLWKSAGIVEQLIDELQSYAKLADAPSLWLEVSESNVEGFELFFEDTDPRQWVQSRKKFVLERFVAHPLSTKTRLKKS